MADVLAYGAPALSEGAGSRMPWTRQAVAGSGARTRVVWFKVCPVLLTSTAALLVAASVL